MPEEGAVARNVTMYPQDWAIVEQLANEQALLEGNISRALRFIIREWALSRLRPDPDDLPPIGGDQGGAQAPF